MKREGLFERRESGTILLRMTASLTDELVKEKKGMEWGEGEYIHY
jgi:hypothetical protein